MTHSVDVVVKRTGYGELGFGLFFFLISFLCFSVSLR